MPDLFWLPLPQHDPRARVAVRAKQQVTDFVGYRATENDGNLKVGLVNPRETHGMVVVDTDKQWRDYKTEEGVLR